MLSMRTLVPLSRHFVLIHVCVDHAYSFLRMLCMRKNCLRVDGLIQKIVPSLFTNRSNLSHSVYINKT